MPGGPLWGAYSESKAEAEAGLLALHDGERIVDGRVTDGQGMAVRIGALAFVYGDGDPHLAQALRWAAHWAGNQRLQMVHHADVAQGLIRLLYAPGRAAGKYNIADDAPLTAVEAHQINGVPVPPGLAGRTDPDPWYGIASTLRIRDELGFRPLYPSVWTARTPERSSVPGAVAEGPPVSARQRPSVTCQRPREAIMAMVISPSTTHPNQSHPLLPSTAV